jgi:hypothetical protein
MNELRGVLDVARSSLGLFPLTYTFPSPAPGTSLVRAADVNEMRNGVK